MKIKQIIISSLMFVFILPVFALSQEPYNFERMWPVLQQPWYFHSPTDAAIDQNGFVYITDTGNHRVLKFTADGYFVANWRNDENWEWWFESPYGIAADSIGLLYITDTTHGAYSHYVQIFTSDGQMAGRWKCEDETGEAFIPSAITIDHEDFVYLTELEYGRIYKFTTDGKLVRWKNEDIKQANFAEPLGLATDNKGFLYITDRPAHRVYKFSTDGKAIPWKNGDIEEPGRFDEPFGIESDGTSVYVVERRKDRVQKFTTDGKFENISWGEEGEGDGQFYAPAGIAVNASGELVYVVDLNNNGVQKFTSQGTFLSKWGSYGSEPGQFSRPMGTAIYGDFIYVADSHNDRIQKFAIDGRFESEWGTKGSDAGQFDSPRGIATDKHGYVYVADSNNKRIQKFDSEGRLQEWEQQDIETQLSDPWDVAVDEDGPIYVADTGSHCILKFKPDGGSDGMWGGFGRDELGKFSSPSGIAIAEGWLYVADSGNDRIQRAKLADNLENWENFGNGQLTSPTGIATDKDGAVYVTEPYYRSRIQKLSPSGDIAGTIGTEGQAPAQLKTPHYLCADPDGRIYVADSGNNRIQVFKPSDLITDTDRAIIIAGGGPYPGNHLWDATRMSASFAYRALNYQGFDKDHIYYLSADTALDLDADGEPDVDNDARIESLNETVAEISAQGNTRDLVVYLVNHGEERRFRMNESETLSASALKSVLKPLADQISGTLIIVYDACQSGTFHSALKYLTDGRHIVITSTYGNESAYFITQGSVSFSNFFWTNIFNGENVKDAFDKTKKAIKKAVNRRQKPCLPAPYEALAAKTYIGNHANQYWNGPIIEPDQYLISITDNHSAELSVRVRDAGQGGIDHVWAVIIPPPDPEGGISDKPVLELPAADLMPAGNDRYKTTYDKFTLEGTYQAVIHARDRKGNTSVTPNPIQIEAGNPRTRKAVIVAGEPSDVQLRSVIKDNAERAYTALRTQYYTHDHIYFALPSSFADVSEAMITDEKDLDTDGFRDRVIGEWAAQDTYDLVLYLIGEGRPRQFVLNSANAVSGDELDQWLDELQDSIPGTVTVIYDADDSGSFIPLLTPNPDKKRIVISGTSSNQPALFSSKDTVCFSLFFWQAVSDGLNLRDAFLNAENALEPFFLGTFRRYPQLDDNGNGIPNERSEGQTALNYTIGAGIRMTTDVSVADNSQIINGETVNVGKITLSGTVKDVWAVVIPPGYNSYEIDAASAEELNKISLTRTDSDAYEGTCSRCFETFGTYQIVVYAEDTQGNISVCQKMPYDQTLPNYPDIYENDNELAEAGFIFLNDAAQAHNFHQNDQETDREDWVKFYASSGETYTIETDSGEDGCDTLIQIHDEDGTLLKRNKSAIMTWTCPENGDGLYYVRIFLEKPFCKNTGYNLKIFIPDAAFKGVIQGVITDAVSKQRIPNAKITTDKYKNPVISLPFTAWYRIPYHEGGNCTVSVEAEGYMPMEKTTFVDDLDPNPPALNFELEPSNRYHSADTNKDYQISQEEIDRVLEFWKEGYHCSPGTADGYAPGPGDENCKPHDSDYKPQDWSLGFDELFRLIEFKAPRGYHPDPSGEDGFNPGKFAR